MYAKDGPTPKMASLKLLEQVRKGPLHDLYRSPGKKLNSFGQHVRQGVILSLDK